jgi:hypothetical protein
MTGPAALTSANKKPAGTAKRVHEFFGNFISALAAFVKRPQVED